MAGTEPLRYGQLMRETSESAETSRTSVISEFTHSDVPQPDPSEMRTVQFIVDLDHEPTSAESQAISSALYEAWHQATQDNSPGLTELTQILTASVDHFAPEETRVEYGVYPLSDE
jgi:hypothetical protein